MRTRTCIAAALITALGACAPATGLDTDTIGPPHHATKDNARIAVRNRTVKRSLAWLRAAYGHIAVRSIHDIPQDTYARYRSYALDGKVYIVVHPGYFPFFDEWSITPIATDYSRRLPRNNIPERIADALTATDVAYQVALQQEVMTRDIIEHLSEERHLVVLVLPRDYRDHLTYGYVAGYDEYARYVNEMTNGADNIVTIESDSHQNGYLRDRDLAVLGAFLDAAGAKTIMLGGGFLGKCLDNFAGSLRKRYPHGSIWYVREITMLSPSDIIADREDFLSFWGGLRYRSIRDHLASIPLNRTTGEALRWADLALFPAGRYR